MSRSQTWRAAGGLLWALIPMLVRAQPATGNVQLSLQQQFGRAVFKECRLDVVVYGDAGTASMRCVRNVVPPTQQIRQRKLTAADATRVAGLVGASNLFGGGHIGKDGTPGDGILETLRVSQSVGTAVLVTSGNDSFTAGARRELLDWLHAVLRDLQEGGK